MTEEWFPDEGDAKRMAVVGLLASLVGLAGYLALHVATHEGITFRLGGREVLWLVGMVVASGLVMLLHELVHGLAILVLGHRPRYGHGIVSGMPYLSTTAPGVRFSRPAFVWVALAPSVLITLTLAAVVAWGPHGGWFILPAVVHLSGCAGDWFLVSRALKAPPGTRIEDLESGMRLHLSAD